jgi:thioredoxin 1
MKIYYFTAKWCGPCKTFGPILNDVVKENLIKVDIDEQPEIASKFNIRGVPTIVLVDEQDKEITRNIGLMTKTKLQNFIDSNVKT